jgi:hypothetical protein
MTPSGDGYPIDLAEEIIDLAGSFLEADRGSQCRAETHPTFASAFRDRRAIVPISVYYQRRSVGGSNGLFAISRRDGEMMGVAGLWEAIRWPSDKISRTNCIITIARSFCPCRARVGNPLSVASAISMQGLGSPRCTKSERRVRTGSGSGWRFSVCRQLDARSRHMRKYDHRRAAC